MEKFDEYENRLKIKKLAELTKEAVGISEEEVKINFVVPLLEFLGHTRINFEYRYKDIVISKGLPSPAKVIIETKKYEKNLRNELNQLERYCHEERPLLGIIANGKELIIFSYFWKFRTSFPKQMIYNIHRKELIKDNIIDILLEILSFSNLKNGSAIKNISLREEKIEDAEKSIKEIESNLTNDENIIESEIQKLKSDIQVLSEKIENLKLKKDKIIHNKGKKIKDIWEKIGICPHKKNEKVPKFTSNNTQITKPAQTGPKGNEKLKDYLEPIIKLMKINNYDYNKACHEIAKKLNVHRSTVGAQCTRGLGIDTETFKKYVKNGRILNLLENKFSQEKIKIIKEIYQ